MNLRERFSPKRTDPCNQQDGSILTMKVDVHMESVDVAIAKAERLRDLLVECDERQRKLIGRFG